VVGRPGKGCPQGLDPGGSTSNVFESPQNGPRDPLLRKEETEYPAIRVPVSSYLVGWTTRTAGAENTKRGDEAIPRSGWGSSFFINEDN